MRPAGRLSSSDTASSSRRSQSLTSSAVRLADVARSQSRPLASSCDELKSSLSRRHKPWAVRAADTASIRPSLLTSAPTSRDRNAGVRCRRPRSCSSSHDCMRSWSERASRSQASCAVAKAAQTHASRPRSAVLSSSCRKMLIASSSPRAGRVDALLLATHHTSPPIVTNTMRIK